MLGSQTWFIALAGPTIIIGGFIASRKRLAYQWREELMDPDSNAYPPVTDADMEYFRRVAPGAVVKEAERVGPRRNRNPEAFGTAMDKAENIGLRVGRDCMTPAEQNVYLNEVRLWSTELGNAVDQRKVSVFEARVARERDNATRAADEARANMARHHGSGGRLRGFFSSIKDTVTGRDRSLPPELKILNGMDTSFYGKLRCISDHAEDIQLMRAPWGSGDRMRQEKMPAALRHLVQTTERTHEGVGRLRHIYIEYSPTGKFFREPRTPKAYDGHDYVVIPLRRDGGDTVVTFAPALRSKFSVLTEVMTNSWTSRDVDAFIPAGLTLRANGLARYDWGWGVRPGPVWFGSRLNMINRSVRDDEARYARNGSGVFLSSLFPFLAPKAGDSSRGARSPGNSTSVAGTAPFAPDAALPLKDAALVVLFFEGPRAESKKRSLLLQPEALIFGKPPMVENFEKWVDDRPTREDVQEEGVVKFMMKRYFEMLTVS